MIPTILVATVVALIVGAILWKMIRDKKKGETSCGCKGCASAEVCHSKKSI